MKFNLTLFLSFLFICLGANAASFVYVTDQVPIPLRSENKLQNNPSNVLRNLPSGTRLEILATENRWTKVKFEKTIGWMLSRYLVATVPAKITLNKLQQNYNANKILLAKQQTAHKKLTKTQKKLKQDNVALLIKINKHKAEKEHVEQVYQDALKLEHANKNLKSQVLRFKSEIQLLNNSNVLAQETSARNWFIVGALVLFIGFFIGFIFTKRTNQNNRRF